MQTKNRNRNRNRNKNRNKNINRRFDKKSKKNKRTRKMGMGKSMIRNFLDTLTRRSRREIPFTRITTSNSSLSSTQKKIEITEKEIEELERNYKITNNLINEYRNSIRQFLSQSFDKQTLKKILKKIENEEKKLHEIKRQLKIKTNLLETLKIKKNMEDHRADCNINEDCALCLDSLKEGNGVITQLYCGHCFHNKCYKEHSKNFNILYPLCPLCQQRIIEPTNFYLKSPRQLTQIL